MLKIKTEDASMKKMIFFIIISIFFNFSKAVFSSYLNNVEVVGWVQENDLVFEKNNRKKGVIDLLDINDPSFLKEVRRKLKGVSDLIDIEDQFNSKRFKKESKRSLSLERLANKEKTLSLEKRRRRKSIEQNEILLNHREMVAFMMRCSDEKYN